MQGWIKIHRKLLEWEWYDEPNTFRLFMHLLLKANHKDRSYRGQTVKAGTLLTGQEVLAEQLGLSRMQIRTALSNLKSTNEITIKSSRQGSVIQLVKYLDYQVVTNGITTEQPDDNQAITSNKNVKKEKNEKKEYIPTYEEFFIHAKSKIDNISPKAVKLKYESWIENDWKDGNDKPIKA